MYAPQELMIRRELAKDPKLANESWDRFLPQFRKKHLKTSEKTAKKNEKLLAKAEARTAAGVAADVEEAKMGMKKEKEKKKVYTPFPPAQQPRKVCSVSQYDVVKHMSISMSPCGAALLIIQSLPDQLRGKEFPVDFVVTGDCIWNHH